jgi:CzcA family heavy metal efflux pump
MTFSPWVHTHRRSILFFLLILVLGGLISSLNLPVALFPEVHFPRIVVNLEAGDRPGERMAVEVTRPVEEAVRAVVGVRHIRSTTSRGSAEISINFDWNEDMVSAMLQTESAVNKTLTSLPPGTTFDVRRMDTTVFPVLCYSLTSDTRSLVELRDIGLYQLVPILSTINGVAKSEVMGGKTEEYRIETDPARLNAFGLTLEDLSKAITAANVLSVAGRQENHDKLYLIMTNTEYHSLEEIAVTPIRASPRGMVRLGDVAEVRKDVAPEWFRVTADGHDAVLLQVFQQPAGNTVQIARDIKTRLDEYRDRLPADVKIANWYDQSELIVGSAKTVRDAMIVGIIFAVLILLIFLWNVKITLIAAIVVPSVLAATTLMLWVFNMSFNIMTLGGMAAAVGLIIDDAIVMVEHVIRRIRQGEGSAQERIALAASEFTRPLSGSSASTIIIFAPLAFLSGVTGSFFKSLSLTMTMCLTISFLISWLALPILARRFLGEKDALHKETGRVTTFFHRCYRGLMGILLPRPWLILLAVAPLLALGWYAYKHVETGFMPVMDEGGFILDYRSAPGTSLAETDRLLRQIEKILQAAPDVQTYSRRTGLQLGGGLTETNEGDFFIRLKPFPRRPIEDVMNDVRRQVKQSIPGLDIELLQLMEDVIGDLIAVPQPIEIELFSDDGRLLNELTPKVAKAIEQVPGVVDVNDGRMIGSDTLDIMIDHEKAAFEGLDAEAVHQMLAGDLAGSVSTAIQRGPKMVNLRVWIPASLRLTDLSILELSFRAPDGHLVPLKRIATVVAHHGMPQIKRDDLKRMLAVTGRIAGRDLGSTIRDIKEILSRPGLLPASVYYRLGGLYAQQQIAFHDMTLVIIAAVLLVFLLLLFLYEQFRVAMAMLITTLLSLTAVFLGLWLTDTELNITSIMGMTMVVGIVTEVSIFYFSEYRELADTDPHSRLMNAGVNRMRPIAMTTLAAILALMPLAMGAGQGAAMQQPLAIAIVAGLLIQLPLSLVVLPCFLLLIRAAHRK